MAAEGPLEVVSASEQSVSFDDVGDQLVSFRVRTPSGLGVASVTVEAISGSERAAQTIEIEVRPSTHRVVDVVGTTLEAGATWQPAAALPGMSGTNEATLEVSRTPPIDLGRRLEYLMRYPHGCAEQTTSGAFPQLFLGRLLELTPTRQTRIEANVRQALTRLRSFQASGGGFGTWPGDDDASDWLSNYAGHFVLEAKAAGYLPPTGMLEQWTGFQRRRTRAWVPGPGRAELTQAYRLYVLALADAPELAAMNQLRERPDLPVTARWRLAAAYELAGQPEAATALAQPGPIDVTPYRELGRTFGSAVRDRAMILESLLVLGRSAAIGPLVQSLSDTLSANAWLSTQETAFALLALAKSAGDDRSEETTFSYTWKGGASTGVSTAAPVWQGALDASDADRIALRVDNTGSGPLYPRLIVSGLPQVGRETAAANGLTLEVAYQTMEGAALDPARLDQGTDFKAVVTVTSSGEQGAFEQLALTPRRGIGLGDSQRAARTRGQAARAVRLSGRA